MLDLSSLLEYLENYLDPLKMSDYCPNGLQVEGKREIGKIATAVSASLQTIEEAVNEEVDALIVHHGMFWNREPYPVVGTKKKKLQLLLENEISLFAYHLPLDAHPVVGNNWRAAKELGWENLEPFGIFEGNAIGVKGNFAPIALNLFTAELEAYYDHVATSALGGKEIVRSAALVSGGAYKELPAAAKEGVDCFITGNFDESAWGMAHEEKINFFALGHTATERIGVKALLLVLEEQFKLPSIFIDTANPF